MQEKPASGTRAQSRARLGIAAAAVCALLAGFAACTGGPLNGGLGCGEGSSCDSDADADQDVDLFIARYDPNGDLEWARRGGGPSSDRASGVAALGDGSAVLTGYFGGFDTNWATFDGATPDEVGFIEADRSLFVVRYSADGSIVWALSDGVGGNGSRGERIAAADDSILVTGRFYGTSTFGLGDAGQTVLDPVSESDMVLVRYDSEGCLEWATSFAGMCEDEDGPSEPPNSLGIDARDDGSSFMAGYFMGAITLGAGEPNQTVLDADGENDMFIAGFGPDGALIWARQANAESGSGGDVSALADGGVIAVGAFYGSALLGEGEPGEVQLDAGGGTDTFFAHYAADGLLEWADRMTSRCVAIDACADGEFVAVGGLDGARPKVYRFDADGEQVWTAAATGGSGSFGAATDVSCLDDGDILATGRFTGTLVFGEGEALETELVAQDADDYLQNADVYLARYAPGGELVWAVRAGGPHFDTAYGLAALPDGSAYIVGTFENEATFGQDEPNQATLVATPALGL